MFNLGFPELLALGALALIVIGPKQLPEVAKVLARTINELKRATKDISGTLANVKSEVRSSVDDIMEDIPTNLDEVSQKLTDHFDDDFSDSDHSTDSYDSPVVDEDVAQVEDIDSDEGKDV